MPSRILQHRAPPEEGPETAVGEAWWALDAETLARRLGSGPQGLTPAEARRRLRRDGPNVLRDRPSLSRLRVLLRQVRSPLLLLLVLAAVISGATGQWVDASIVIAIVLASVGIGYTREYGAATAVDALRARVHTRARAVRDGKPQPVPMEDLVAGDVVLLAAGTLVPADAVLLEATDCYVGEAALTGESFPVAKTPGVSPEAAPVARRANAVFLGTTVRSGTARALVVRTGRRTEMGSIAHQLVVPAPETEFERGLRRFGGLLTVSMLVLVLLVFGAHVLRGSPAAETLLFAIALAVGLSPELLPAILSINLARGAEEMSRRGVLVRRLEAIENLGSMDVLCTDKTGTLTEGTVRVEGSYDPDGAPSEAVLDLAAVNASLSTGLANPLDDAIRKARKALPAGLRKRAEVPFDAVRKRSSVVVAGPEGVRLVTKGALRPVLDVCRRLAGGGALDAERRAGIESRAEEWARRGMRVLAVAQRDLDERPSYGREDERDLAFAGFLAFLDRPKKGAAEALSALADLGVAVKLVTGDSRPVAEHVARLVGLPAARVLTGEDIHRLPDPGLARAAQRTDLFVEVDPLHKERIIRALRSAGHVVGFLGDGVNDAPAMHDADTSLSVEGAVDVARETADFVLLERDLDVIRRGIEEGRRTFANTLKYVLTTLSANLGNMTSMAVASLFLPFLPLLPGQILLNNFLSDVPAVGLAGDAVDPEMVRRPRRWDVRFVARFMVEFGLASSLFDFLTFAVLLGVFHATPEEFRTGWFVESLLTELVIALVVRTRRLFFRSRPGRLLLGATLVLAPVVLAIPYLPGAGVLGFVPVPASFLGALLAITALYVAATEALKRLFYRRAEPAPAGG